MIGQYSPYQAALCAHNLEGHIISLYGQQNILSIQLTEGSTFLSAYYQSFSHSYFVASTNVVYLQ